MQTFKPSHINYTEKSTSKNVEYECPDGIYQQNDYPDSVGNPVALREGIPEPTRCSDMFLQQIASDDQTNQDTNPAVPYGVSKKAWSHHNDKDQSCRQF